MLVVCLGLLVGLAAYVIWRGGWRSKPHLIDQVDPPPRVDTAPIVLVGVIESDRPVRNSVPMRSNPKYPLQFRRLSLRVENVLRGGPLPPRVDVYYFAFAGGFDGPQPLGSWKVGSRRIFWIRRDSGVLRTACDGWDYCTRKVGTGAHLDYRADPKKPLDYALVDLLFTRGTGTIEENSFGQGLDEVTDRVPGLQAYSIPKLTRLAETEGGWIRSCACKTLWIYTVDHPIDPTVHRDAVEALRAANCHCAAKPDGNEDCN